MLLTNNKQKVCLAVALLVASVISHADSIDDVIAGKADAEAQAEKQKEANKSVNGMSSVDYANQIKEMKKQRLEATNNQLRTPPKLIAFRGVKGGRYLAKFEMSDGQILSAADTHPSVGLWRVIKVDGASVTVRFSKDKNSDAELQVNENFVSASTSSTSNTQNTSIPASMNPSMVIPVFPPTPTAFH